jgi:hypothetical protein
MLFFVVHRLGGSRKSAREAAASRLFCFTAGFSGSPNGIRFQAGRRRSLPVHNPTVTVPPPAPPPPQPVGKWLILHKPAKATHPQIRPQLGTRPTSSYRKGRFQTPESQRRCHRLPWAATNSDSATQRPIRPVPVSADRRPRRTRGGGCQTNGGGHRDFAHPSPAAAHDTVIDITRSHRSSGV